jgi:hypothetical protein
MAASSGRIFDRITSELVAGRSATLILVACEAARWVGRFVQIAAPGFAAHKAAFLFN